MNASKPPRRNFLQAAAALGAEAALTQKTRAAAPLPKIHTPFLITPDQGGNGIFL